MRWVRSVSAGCDWRGRCAFVCTLWRGIASRGVFLVPVCACVCLHERANAAMCLYVCRCSTCVCLPVCGYGRMRGCAQACRNICYAQLYVRRSITNCLSLPNLFLILFLRPPICYHRPRPFTSCSPPEHVFVQPAKLSSPPLTTTPFSQRDMMFLVRPPPVSVPLSRPLPL